MRFFVEKLKSVLWKCEVLATKPLSTLGAHVEYMERMFMTGVKLGTGIVIGIACGILIVDIALVAWFGLMKILSAMGV